MTVTVRSFAKINLGLCIGAAREDGFHELLTVYQTIALHDTIHVTVERGTGVEIRCADPRVPKDESNTCFRIVERAIRALRAKGRVVVEIEKRLPVQGGLGGASGNAVATLLALERAMCKCLSPTERFRIAADVGSDLALFLIGGTVLGLGRGEQVYPLRDLPAIACVIVTPDVGVSTPKAFVDWDRQQGLIPYSDSAADAALARRASTQRQTELKTLGSAAELHSARRPSRPSRHGSKLTLAGTSGRMNELSRELSAWLSEPYSSAPFRRGQAENPLLWLVRAGIENDFEKVVFPEYPELREGKVALVRAGAKYASLSGSGSTLYGLFASKDAATRALVRLRKQGWGAQVTSTLTRQQYWRRMVAG